MYGKITTGILVPTNTVRKKKHFSTFDVERDVVYGMAKWYCVYVA
jgi:hypothetical protein